MCAPVELQTAGAVSRAGTQILDSGARLGDAALAAKPLPQAYLLGAAWMRPALKESQTRLKAGVLFDLAALQQGASRGNHRELKMLADGMTIWIGSMPITGRQTALLDPRAVEATPSENRPVADGDFLYYPLRPHTIRIVGAVQQRCALAFVPLQDARLYLNGCPITRDTDLDRIYVIQPDGRVFVQGIALWNRDPPMPLAPGAVIYVPLSTTLIAAIDPSMNRDLVNFLATQLLPWIKK
jgi:hypothetical protein